MSLSSLQLDAFLAVSRTESFTAAAVNLHITQSALSQRIKNLEQELGATLFTRDPQGIRPTELGHRLLRFCQAKDGLESEFLETLRAKSKNELRGIVRIAGYSSINRSVLLPSLKELMQKNPDLQLDLKLAELGDIPQLLFSGRTEFAFTNQPISREGVASKIVGHERYIVAQSTNATSTAFLDHDQNDLATMEYFRATGRSVPHDFRRHFAGDMD